MFRKLTYAALAVALPAAVNAAAVIADGDIKLGVDDYGQLNPTSVTTVADVVGETIAGVRWIDSATGDEYESTSHGCLCEGWGVSTGGIDAYANNAFGVTNMTVDSFASTATTATSVVDITGADVTVTHDFALSAVTDSLYQVTVTITNDGATDISDLIYRRAMDWDTSPTPFNEYVTIGGTATTSLLDYSSDDGFANSMSDPGTDLAGCGTTVDFTACGPSDHGAVFDFALETIAAGDSYSFTIFYGGALGLDAANAALGAVGAELYSFGWSGRDVDQDGYIDGTTDLAPTFIFAFAGVGGEVVIPDPGVIPLPASAWLLLGGLAGLFGLRRRKAA